MADRDKAAEGRQEIERLIEAVRYGADDDLGELRDSMRANGWFKELPAIADADGVIIGKRRMRIAEELGIEPVIQYIDKGDVYATRLAIASNIGSKPLTLDERRRIAHELYATGEWSMAAIEELLGVTQPTISRDLQGMRRPESKARIDLRGRARELRSKGLTEQVVADELGVSKWSLRMLLYESVAGDDVPVPADTPRKAKGDHVGELAEPKREPAAPPPSKPRVMTAKQEAKCYRELATGDEKLEAVKALEVLHYHYSNSRAAMRAALEHRDPMLAALEKVIDTDGDFSVADALDCRQAIEHSMDTTARISSTTARPQNDESPPKRAFSGAPSEALKGRARLLDEHTEAC